jgi:hypothetical protein
MKIDFGNYKKPISAFQIQQQSFIILEPSLIQKNKIYYDCIYIKDNVLTARK